MSDFEVQSKYMMRTDSQKNRHFLVKNFIAHFAKEQEGGRIEFKDLQKGINTFLAKSGSEHIGRIELSRCLKILKVELGYYHGAYLSGYDWIAKKPTRIATFRVDPTGYLELWKEECLLYQPDFCTSTNRAYQSFCEWCEREKKTKCTLNMFVRRMNWLLDSNDGKPDTHVRYTYTYWDGYILDFDYDVYLKTHERVKRNNLTKMQWSEIQTQKRGYYVRISERKS
jgi:hypothetical protein